ncbi:MAG TPA: hypothetical protein VN451_08740, partial [Chitinophagaceae bacterium]|nr:hypothetical protein [Chitinophagaceae bacterium]
MKIILIFGWVCFTLAVSPELAAQTKRIITNNSVSSKIIRSGSPAPNNPSACSADTIILTTQAQIDNFSTTYPACTTPKYLFINGAGANPAITNLNGLSSLTQIINKLMISHTSITDLSALSNLTQIGDTLQLDHNALMASIGLNNLTYLGSIIFLDLPVLTSIDGLSNNIDSIGAVNIDSTALTNLNGLSGIVQITNGEFYGLRIAHTPITNLSSLTNLSIINGYIILDDDTAITSIGLTNLTQCSGFLFANVPNLTSIANLSYNLSNTNISTFWMINTGLTNMTGLDSLTSSSNFYIWGNSNLVSLNGLENLTGNINGGISIWNNNLLTNISALSNITSINDGTLEIHGNNLLSNFTGLGNITTIGKRLRIFENPNITTLNILNPSLVILDSDNEGVEIHDNSQLSLCSFAPLCNYLNNAGTGDIHDNAPGCNSIAEILATCNACTSNLLKTWTGAIDADWDITGNWSPAGTPASCDTVYIPSGLSNYPVVNSTKTIGGLIMESGSSLDLDNFSLINNGAVNIFDAAISSTNNSNSIIFRKATNPYIENATLSAVN